MNFSRRRVQLQQHLLWLTHVASSCTVSQRSHTLESFAPLPTSLVGFGLPGTWESSSQKSFRRSYLPEVLACLFVETRILPNSLRISHGLIQTAVVIFLEGRISLMILVIRFFPGRRNDEADHLSLLDQLIEEKLLHYPWSSAT